MSLYADKWWLLSHIQHSFTISDSTGHSEQVMTASDKAFTDARIRQMAKEEGTACMLADTDTEDEDEETQDGAAAASYDILLGTKHVSIHYSLK